MEHNPIRSITAPFLKSSLNMSSQKVNCFRKDPVVKTYNPEFFLLCQQVRPDGDSVSLETVRTLRTDEVLVS